MRKILWTLIPIISLCMTVTAYAEDEQLTVKNITGEITAGVNKALDDESKAPIVLDDDSERLAKIVMAEAEGEPLLGKVLVACTVLNRVESDDFPDTVDDVITQPRQFSPVSNGSYAAAVPSQDCWAAVEIALAGWDPSNGALYFESVKGSSWHSRNKTYLYKVGNHNFYK